MKTTNQNTSLSSLHLPSGMTFHSNNQIARGNTAGSSENTQQWAGYSRENTVHYCRFQAFLANSME